MVIRIKYWALLVACLFFADVNCQNQQKIDSLTVLVSNAAPDSNKVNLLFKLGNQFTLDNPKNRIENFIMALALAKKINYVGGLKKIYKPLISALFYKEMYELSCNYCLEYIELCEKQKLTEEKFLIYGLFGTLLTNTGKYDEAFKYYNGKRQYDLQREDYRSYASTLNNMSILHLKNNQYDSALVYSLWATEIFKRNNMSPEMAGSVLQVAECYLKKADLEKAVEKADEAYTLYSVVNYKSGMCSALYVLASAFTGLNKPDSAFKLYSKALLFADSLNLVKMQRNCYKGLSDMYLGQKNYKEAYEYGIITGRYQDSVAVSLQRGKTLESDVKYDLIKNENEVKEKEFEQRSKGIAKSFLFTTIGGFLILMGVSYLAFFRRKKPE